MSPDPISKSKKIPCDVNAVLAKHCWDCHSKDGDHPAPMNLESWDDLHAQAPVTTDAKVYDQVITRVTSKGKPMPPKQYDQLSEDEIQILKDWVDDGAPARKDDAECEGESGDGDDEPSGDDVGDGDGDDSVGDGDGDGDDYGDDLEPVNPDPKSYKALMQSGGPEECGTYYELRAHGAQTDYDKTPFKVDGKLGNDGNQYHCFYFKPPYGTGEQALWFKPMVDESKILHHWLLYGTDSLPYPSGSSAPCSAAEPGAYLLAGWAPGAGETLMPKDVALQMPSGGVSGLILEVHYFNQADTKYEDTTGVKFCTVPKGTRKNEAAVHFTGGENICLPPMSSPKVEGICNPPDDAGDIHIINVWPHMHKKGNHMSIKINRKGGGTETLHDADFDFENQISHPINDVVLKNGDTMTTVCSYTNDENRQIPFGEKTQTEMCYGFVTAWPAGKLVQDPWSYDPVQAIGTGIQPARRCLDPTGIFKSCNGLADYPLPR